MAETGGKTIALYIGSLKKGGAERVVANLAGYFCSQDYRVVLVTANKEEEEYEVAQGVVRRIAEPSPDRLKGGRAANFAARFGRLKEIWKQEKPDVILSFIGKCNLMAILTSMGLKIPVVVSVRGEPTEEYYNWWMRFMARHLFGFAAGMVLQTRRSAAFFPERVRKKAVVLKNPVQQVFFRKRYEGEREKAIVAVGRVDENKNHELLIRAFAGIAEEFPEYRLIIYGDGDKRGALLKLPDQLGLKERISLPGNGSGIAELIYKARVFVQPSNTEGMPNTLIEAMLLGLTVIATDCPCGGPAELIEDGVNGLLTPVGDVEKLKECLRRVLKDQRMADEMGIRAAGLQKDYRTDIVYESWRNFLERVMKRGI